MRGRPSVFLGAVATTSRSPSSFTSATVNALRHCPLVGRREATREKLNRELISVATRKLPPLPDVGDGSVGVSVVRKTLKYT
jgi:hypothetical protein